MDTDDEIETHNETKQSYMNKIGKKVKKNVKI